jgi:predicted short-subunit dehydrogenase-like oxidoreductase (DUF2520 family)
VFLNVSIIGSGNVATQLGKAFVNSGTIVTHVASRNKANASTLAENLNASACNIDELPENQLAVICVSDDAISEVIEKVPIDTPIVYTSGSVGIDELPKRDRLGVFYPLQTFSKTSEVNMTEVPFLLESENAQFLDAIYDFATLISPSTFIVSSEQRRKIHIAAVWINNFTNHVVHQAQKITQEQDLNYQLLLPLLKETLRKLDNQTAFDAQTGPARRGDSKTIEKHLNAQEGSSKELYQLLTQSILETYKDEEL